MAEPPPKRQKGFRAFNPSASDDKKRDAGNELLGSLLMFYATCKLTAKDMCHLCQLAHDCGCVGAAFSDYAYTGKDAQRHLDGVLPRGGEMVQVSAPMNMKKDNVRSVHKVPTRVLWSSLEKEVRNTLAIKTYVNSAATSRPPSCMDTPAYNSHPKVAQAKTEGKELPIPLAIYIDGVSFVSSAAGRCESCIGFWLENLLTSSRTFITSVKSADLCSCGCKGWCSLRPILRNIEWQLESIQSGLVPSNLPDGKRYVPEASG